MNMQQHSSGDTESPGAGPGSNAVGALSPTSLAASAGRSLSLGDSHSGLAAHRGRGCGRAQSAEAV